MVAWPPPNSVLKVPWKFSRMAENASRKRCLLVSSIFLDGVAGRCDRIGQVLALRRQELMACIQLVELIDGHHIDRSEPIDFLSQPADVLLWCRRCCHGGFWDVHRRLLRRLRLSSSLRLRD